MISPNRVFRIVCLLPPGGSSSCKYFRMACSDPEMMQAVPVLMTCIDEAYAKYPITLVPRLAKIIPSNLLQFPIDCFQPIARGIFKEHGIIGFVVFGTLARTLDILRPGLSDGVSDFVYDVSAFNKERDAVFI